MKKSKSSVTLGTDIAFLSLTFTSRVYISVRGVLAFPVFNMGRCVPDKFAYPTETTVITNAYSKFADWAHDQSSTTDWYKTVSSDKVIQY